MMHDPARAHFPGRASLDDFRPAFDWIRTDLVAHDREHGQAWRSRSVLYHVRHALVHLGKVVWWMALARPAAVDMNLTHAGCRVLMALTLWSTRRPFRACLPAVAPRKPGPIIVPTGAA